MEQYLPLFGDVGREPTVPNIEELLNGTATVQINAPLAFCEMAAHTQWVLLHRMKKGGHLP